MICVHCCKKKVNRPRGLCWGCYYTPGVRDLYPITSKFGKRSGVRPEPVTCWACGKPAGRKSHVNKIGWKVRHINLTAQSRPTNEVYCPECFARWGWPDWSKMPALEECA
jgi:hypothetical protein